MRGRLATECGYKQDYIDLLEFSTALKMAEYWQLEPPAAWLMQKYWGFGPKQEEQTSDIADRVLPHHYTPFHRLPAPIKRLNTERWLRLNPGKTERDFYKHLETVRLDRYAEHLKEARKQNG